MSDKYILPVDDEFDEEAAEQLERIDRDMAMMADERSRIQHRARPKTLDPGITKIIQLAQGLGHALGANEALGNRVKHLEKRIAVRDEMLEETIDRNAWKERAEKAEATLARSRAARRRR